MTREQRPENGDQRGRAGDPDLETLYREARSAKKKREYDRASDLLRQILLIDENYKDASRLLAQTVQLRRRRWYNSPRWWGTFAAITLIGLLIWLVPEISLPVETPLEGPATVSVTPSPTLTSPKTEMPTETGTPAPTPIPLAWKRIYIGQDLPRDTVTAFVIDPKDPDVLYASMENAGAYKSIDGGLSWRPVLKGLTDIQVESLLVDGRDTQNVYAGTPSGIFKTEDGGENWSRVGEGRQVLIDPENNAHLYARDDDNIYESTDQGNTWEAVYSSQSGCPGKIVSWTIHPVDGSMLYLAGGAECERGVYQSNDRGRTWTLVQKVENPPGYELAPELDYLIVRMDWLVVGFDNGNVTVDYGPAWETRDAAGFVYSRCWEPFLQFLCRYRPNGEQTVRLGKPDVWADGSVAGISFERAMAGWTIAIAPYNPDTIYVASEGIAVTRDGGLTWKKLNNGLGNTNLELAAGLGNENTLFLLPGICNGEFTDSRHDLAQSLYLSTNGGGTWDFVTQAGCHLIMDRNGSTMYRLSTNYWWAGQALRGWLWRSQDGGRAWRRILIPPSIETIVTHASQTGHLYGFGQDPFYQTSVNPNFQEKYYFYSGDYGHTWNEQEPPAGAKLCYGSTLQFIDAYRPMAIDPGDGNHVFVIDNGKLLESHDSCDTTEPFASDPNTSMNSIAFDPNDSSTLYAGTDGGAYVSFDDGKTWHEINDGLLGATVVYSIVVDRDSNVYAATPYGVFQLEKKE